MKRSLRDKRLEEKEEKQGFIKKTTAGALVSTERCEAVMEKKSSNIEDLPKELVRVFKELICTWLLQGLEKKLNTLKCHGGRELLRQIHTYFYIYMYVHIHIISLFLIGMTVQNLLIHTLI